MEKIDWTHKDVYITDIRKISKLYIISIADKKISSPLFVNQRIFEERLRSYFLKEPSDVSREEILGVKWNLYISKGFYIKVNFEGEVKNFDMDENKFYISYLEIAGPLAAFQTYYN